MRNLLISIFVLLTLLALFGFYSGIKEEKSVIETKEELRRLSAVSLRMFKGKTPPTEAIFWKELGRAPMKDHWGQDYRLESGAAGILWRSSGPDRLLHTSDDIVVPVLFDADSSSGAPPVDSRVMEAN